MKTPPSTTESLATTLTTWRKRTTDGPTYVDRVVNRRLARPALAQAAYAAEHAPALADVGDVIAEPCPSCGGPLTVVLSEPPDAVHTECQSADCYIATHPRPPRKAPR